MKKKSTGLTDCKTLSSLLGRHGAMTAVCFSGWFNVSVAPQKLREKLIDPLNADIFMYLTHRRDDACTSSEQCRLEERFAELRPIRRLVLEPMRTAAELAAALEALPHWDAVKRAVKGNWSIAGRWWRMAIGRTGSARASGSKPRPLCPNMAEPPSGRATA